MIQRVTVIPEKRALGVGRLDLPKVQTMKIVAGRFDTGCAPAVIPTIRRSRAKRKGGPAHPFMPASAALTVFGSWRTCPKSSPRATGLCQ